ncbi:MAG: toprim domain-containing protein [Candidatus Bathyarchaeia archaeon]
MKLRTKPPPSSSASMAELTEMLQRWIELLGEKSAEGGIILVEGVKDAEALRRAGVNGEILCVKSRQATLADVLHPLVDVNREVIVLPDFDRRGKQLAGRIVRYLQGRGGNPNLRFWLRVHGLGASHVKDVEGLIAYLENVKRNTMT